MIGDFMEDFEKTLAKLKDAARMEDWRFVDSFIPATIREPRFYKWAFEMGMDPQKEPNVDVRDLAARVIEKADIPPEEFSDMHDALFEHMVSDENKYVRFRSAFALANHGPGQYNKQVMNVLREASRDKDVKEIAEKYLHRIERKRVAR